MSALSKVRGVTITKDATKRMEDEARKMELKMEMLRKTLDGPDGSRNSGRGDGDSGSRWRSGTAKKPLRTGYVKEVLDTKATRKQPRNETGGRAAENSGANLSASRGGSGQTTPTQVEASGTFSSALAGDFAVAAGGGGRASSNLQAALQQQSRESLEVESFLAGLGLDRYVSLFMEHGFDCMEVVKEMQETHMRDIGMATGHALKLRKRLAELNPSPPPAPASVPEAKQPGALSRSAQKRVSFGSTEEAKAKSPSGAGTGTGTGGGSLLDGHFDEAAEKASFQDAVRAWREGRSSDEGQSAKAEPTAPTAKVTPGSFWTSVGTDEVNLERCSTPLSAPAGTQSETQHDPAPSEEKLCCYNCYKQFFARYAVERCSPLPDQTVRRLCSTVCADLWVVSQQARVNELLQRQEKLAKLEEIQRVMDHEMKSSQAEPSVEPLAGA